MCELLFKTAFFALATSFQAWSVLAATDSSPSWGYDGLTGPLKWHQLSPLNKACSQGAFQSPINLNSKSATPIPPSYYAVTYQTASNFTLQNTHHTIQVNIPQVAGRNGLHWSGGGVTPGEYALQQFHFHTPSEHRINGEGYPLEWHWVHKDKGLFIV
jgi:carbonic anhydrase